MMLKMEILEEEPNIVTGDPVQCKGCQAILSSISTLEREGDQSTWVWYVPYFSLEGINYRHCPVCIPSCLSRSVCYLFVLRFNIPVNNFSVISGWNHHFLGIDQYSGELMCLAQGLNRCLVWGWNLGSHDSESDSM